jgi:hypothetical protein
VSTLSDLTRTSYYDLARQGQLFIAYATVTAPVIWSTAAGTGGPLLWNNSNAGKNYVNAVIMGIGAAVTTAATAASSLGITGGASTAPSSTTSIDAVKNCLIGGPAPVCNTYRIGTVSTAGTFFMPVLTLGTGALTVSNVAMSWVDIGGAVVVPPGCFASVAGSATATTAVADIALLWAEIPI